MIDRIVALINERGINGVQLARETGLPPNAISVWKKGTAEPGTKAIIKIAAYFGVTTDYLLGLTDNPRPPDALPIPSTAEEILAQRGITGKDRAATLESILDLMAKAELDSEYAGAFLEKA